MSKNKDEDAVSRLMCFALRHKPEVFGLTLDVQGWVSISDLAKALDIRASDIMQIAASDAKGRYGLRAHHTEIRCVQGHSTKQVCLDFDVAEPPEVLYHGTRRHVLDAIFKEGITPQTRHLVHLSADDVTAYNVANRRRGTWAILAIKAADMHRTGEYVFYRSENGVWLTKHVPPQYLGLIRYDTASNWTSRN